VQPRAAQPATPKPKPLIAMPKRPFRDGAIFHGVLAVLLVLVAWITGGEIWRAVVVGALYFVVATAWTWWRFRQRLRREQEGTPGAKSSNGEEGT
jgi:membrane protein implicated in regulation of membrane protease activity